jgi:chemotaxis protein methyltransferase CheR
MTGPDFDHFCRLMRERSGLVLSASKAYLVNGRLEPVARAAGLGSVDALLSRLRVGAPDDLIRQCADAMATHESSFFRDGAPFEHIGKSVLPDLIARRQTRRKLRIWCAACSSGQEPYSMAMLLKETPLLAGWALEIVATDMSEAILSKASSGIYSDFEVRRGLSPDRLSRWFEPHGEDWRVLPALRQMISFQAHNLLKGAAGLGLFDMILCRNVLIYFDLPNKREVFGHLDRVLSDDGTLCLGSSETVIGVVDSFATVEGARGLYRKVAAGPEMTARLG